MQPLFAETFRKSGLSYGPFTKPHITISQASWRQDKILHSEFCSASSVCTDMSRNMRCALDQSPKPKLIPFPSLHYVFYIAAMLQVQVATGLQSLSRSPRELGSLAQLEDYNILYCTVLYCTVLYCTVLYCTVLYCTVLYCTILYCTVLYCTLLHCTVLYCTVLYCTVLCCTVLCCTVLYCTVLYCTVMYCTVLYHTVMYHTVLYCTIL